MNLYLAVALFLAYILIDALYAIYTFSIAKNRPLLAATSGTMMYGLALFGLSEFAKNNYYLVPILSGSWVGTYFTVILINRKKKTK